MRQVLARFWRHVYRPRLCSGEDVSLRVRPTSPVPFLKQHSSYVDGGSLRFLNLSGDVTAAGVWEDHRYPLLWLYHLHYFDDLNSAGADSRLEWHKAFVRRWIAENQSPPGIGWDAYPVSRRVVNWIKWHTRTGSLEHSDLASLLSQARWLSARLEFHLLGNHLLENVRAMIIAGCFFGVREADQWRLSALALLREQLDEQVLADGGHFERSPMYQAIILEGLLDIANFLQAYGHVAPTFLVETCRLMLQWLKVMCHPDGDISLFNDSALSFGPSANELFDYARRLGFDQLEDVQRPAHVLRDSGFVRASTGDAVLLLDVGPLGPDYLLAHGHADTFTFELSIQSRRVIVDSGTSTYERGLQRATERSTQAHNTVELDSTSSSETWASFRVARRAKVSELAVDIGDDGSVQVAGRHDGYRRLPGRPWHLRRWTLRDRLLVIEDEIDSLKDHDIRVPLLVHPQIVIERLGPHTFAFRASNAVLAVVRCDEAFEARLEPCHYHPQFGVDLPTERIVTSGSTSRRTVVRTVIQIGSE